MQREFAYSNWHREHMRRNYNFVSPSVDKGILKRFFQT